ncbi:MAG: AAA family ATPase [Candidatus Paceibacterota bacterium]|jgi:hypothetical protein
MRIKELVVKDYNGVREAGFYDMGDLVVIAGPNGVGKTKIKESICHVFQNSGNPPSGSSVVLGATNEEETSAWNSSEITLPNQKWQIFSSIRRKKIRTKARLIQIESDRQIESMQFQTVNLGQIGNPEEEEADSNYSIQKVRDRFKDIASLLLKQKTKFLMDCGSSIDEKSRANPGMPITVDAIDDPTKKFEYLFESLLYPKRMAPIDPSKSNIIQYYDDEANLRDITALSSGEKEVMVLAFDILMQSPSDCIILIDEPELHLHPELTFRLTKVLKSIGERNQIFLFTHSTDIISSSFESGVYFIRPKKIIPSGNQVLRVGLDNIDDLINLPNLRETIGMISLGKKLLFVEGTGKSIDRNVFATISRSTKLDMAIIPSDSCNNINNLNLICDTLQKGILGVDLFMCRDRDSLTDEEVDIFTKKSNGRLMFLPFYHIENIFLFPKAIFKIAQDNGNSKTLKEIEDKLVEFAKEEINSSVIRYVVSEIRFKAGNFDSSPKASLPPEKTEESIIAAIKSSCEEKISQYATLFSEEFIRERVKYWNNKFNQSLSSGWSDEARTIFYGKGLLNRMQDWLFKGKKIIIWDQIINNKSEECLEAIEPLKKILEKV